MSVGVVIAHVSAAASGWHFEPLQTLGLAAIAGLYFAGCARFTAAGHSVGWLRPASFMLGWSMLVVALISPLHSMAEVFLSGHMTQHTLLLLAPLPLIGGKVGTRSLQALPTSARGRLARLGPRLYGFGWQMAALVVLGVTVVVWHAPPVFEAAARAPFLHAVEHVSLMSAAGLYWITVIGFGPYRAGRSGMALLSIFLLMLLGGAVGGLMTFSTTPWYPEYAATVNTLGGDWLADQQLAGILMWLPMGVVLMGVGAWLAYRWQTSTATTTKVAVQSP